jgi:hypothetical protein
MVSGAVRAIIPAGSSVIRYLALLPTVQRRRLLDLAHEVTAQYAAARTAGFPDRPYAPRGSDNA